MTPTGVDCPECDGGEIHEFGSKPEYVCGLCDREFSSSLFHGLKLDL